jgi:hypothetical protein
VQVRLHAFGFPNAPPQTLHVIVNGRAHGPLAVSPGWHDAELIVDRAAWRAGVNRLRLDFAWGTRPADVGLGNDPRVLAAAVDFIRIAKVD